MSDNARVNIYVGKQNTATKFFAGYAGLWLILAGMANVKSTAGLAAAFGWLVTAGAAITLLPNALKDFRITGDIIGHPIETQQAVTEPQSSASMSRGSVSPSAMA